ncbi:cytochrome c oxidase assembly factor 8 [Tachypleus tridentatus]|uniref:cytochrome c oxidase assembly factor 8 n=1 Tax=Tachypleus tridentatus TaxID=6853 RepID=UPI003FD52B28
MIRMRVRLGIFGSTCRRNFHRRSEKTKKGFHENEKNICKDNEEENIIYPKATRYDWIGPPDPVSNIPPVVYFIRENETMAEKRFREKKAATLAWNQQFWRDHNYGFQQRKEEFIQERLIQLKAQGNERQSLTYEEMSEFYKKFLDENHQKHITYNWTWYYKNVGLVWFALKALVAKSASKCSGKIKK